MLKFKNSFINLYSVKGDKLIFLFFLYCNAIFTGALIVIYLSVESEYGTSVCFTPRVLFGAADISILITAPCIKSR